MSLAKMGVFVDDRERRFLSTASAQTKETTESISPFLVHDDVDDGADDDDDDDDEEDDDEDGGCDAGNDEATRWLVWLLSRAAVQEAGE